jgi:hypothetical protein
MFPLSHYPRINACLFSSDISVEADELAHSECVRPCANVASVCA